MKEKRDVYMSKRQQEIYYGNARDVRVLAARRFGKTDSVIAPRVYRVSKSLPRSTNAWLGSSRKQLMTRTIPGAMSALQRYFGLQEGRHFGFGQPPKWVPSPIMKPKSWDNTIWFANGAIWQIISLSVIGSANGLSLTSIVADECKFLSKSKIDGEVMPALSGITHPLGDPAFSESNPLYKSTCFVSDAALTTKGNWLEKEEELLATEIQDGIFAGKTYQSLQDELTDYADRIMFYNDLLREAKKDGCRPIVLREDKIKEIKVVAEAMMNHDGCFKILPKYGKRVNRNMVEMAINYNLINPDDAEYIFCYKYLITPEQFFDMQRIDNSKKYKEHIRELQCAAFCFYRANTLDNLDILREDYIARMKRDLPPLVFAISILNKKQTKSSNGFYANLDIENVHGYVPDDCPAIESAMCLKTASTVHGGQKIDTSYETLDFGELQNVKNCTLDGDVVDSLPLYIAIDYNANINFVVTCQLYERNRQQCMNVISSMFVKNEKMLRELVADWSHYYKPHQAKNNNVTYFYNKTAKMKNYAVAGTEDFKDIVISELRKYGWCVRPVDMGDTTSHELKYNEINESLAGVAYPAIRINRENNEALIIAMQNAGVRTDYKGFHKDKSGEKLSEDADDAVRLEYRTDGTDAFDDLYHGVRHFLTSMSGMCMPLR